jgi:hypothetical protein
MFSFVERATARAWARGLVIVLATALLCGLFLDEPAAREADRTPYEMPGDADGIGGCKSLEFESGPDGYSKSEINQTPLVNEHSSSIIVLKRHALMIIQLLLITRK